jgi:hypothetical protein
MTETEKRSKERLALRFHQTFIPERRYLSALLRFAAEDGTGDNLHISEETGIPTGKSSGKVPAMLQYAQGMGLVAAEGKGADRRIRPTAWGETVLTKDSQLSEAITQWLLHLNLCRCQGGAEVWFRTFGPGSDFLGRRFDRQDLDQYLSGLFGAANRSLIGPLQRTYEEPAALKKTGALITEKTALRRNPAPLTAEFANGWAWFLLTLWHQHFPNNRQATVIDVETETFWGRLHGWNDAQRERALALIQTTGAISIDKQMQPWVLTRGMNAADLLARIIA